MYYVSQARFYKWGRGMATPLTDVLREINEFPKESLRAGLSKEDRRAELLLLSKFFSPTLILCCDFSPTVKVRFGCVRRKRTVGLLVRITNGSYTELFTYLNPRTDILRLKKNKRYMKNVPQTTEEFSQFIEKIAFA